MSTAAFRIPAEIRIKEVERLSSTSVVGQWGDASFKEWNKARRLVSKLRNNGRTLDTNLASLLPGQKGSLWSCFSKMIASKQVC